mgnify:FL=1
MDVHFEIVLALALKIAHGANVEFVFSAVKGLVDIQRVLVFVTLFTPAALPHI